jgi:hypothetical protein
MIFFFSHRVQNECLHLIGLDLHVNMTTHEMHQSEAIFFGVNIPTHEPEKLHKNLIRQNVKCEFVASVKVFMREHIAFVVCLLVCMSCTVSPQEQLVQIEQTRLTRTSTSKSALPEMHERLKSTLSVRWKCLAAT